MVEHSKVVKEGFKFSLDPKRWLPFFVTDSLFFMIVIGYVLINLFKMKFIFSKGINEFLMFSSVLGMMTVLFFVLILYALVRIYIQGALIHQSIKPKEFDKSWTISKKRYLSLLATVFMIALISSLVGMVPYIGWIFSIIVSLVFFFALPAVILDKIGFSDALSKSYNIFRKKAGDVFVVWLIIATVSMVIFFIFSIPLFSVLFTMFFPFIIGARNSMGPEVISLLVSGVWILVPSFVILFIGNSVSKVFGIYAISNFYQEFKKKSKRKRKK